MFEVTTNTLGQPNLPSVLQEALCKYEDALAWVKVLAKLKNVLGKFFGPKPLQIKVWRNGGSSGARTQDQRIKSPVLYQLS